MQLQRAEDTIRTIVGRKQQRANEQRHHTNTLVNLAAPIIHARLGRTRITYGNDNAMGGRLLRPRPAGHCAKAPEVEKLANASTKPTGIIRLESPNVAHLMVDSNGNAHLFHDFHLNEIDGINGWTKFGRCKEGLARLMPLRFAQTSYSFDRWGIRSHGQQCRRGILQMTYWTRFLGGFHQTNQKANRLVGAPRWVAPKPSLQRRRQNTNRQLRKDEGDRSSRRRTKHQIARRTKTSSRQLLWTITNQTRWSSDGKSSMRYASGPQRKKTRSRRQASPRWPRSCLAGFSSTAINKQLSVDDPMTFGVDNKDARNKRVDA